MKKICLLLALSFGLTLLTYADEPVPVMRSAAPDVPSEVKSDDSDYLPNIIKQHKDTELDTTDKTQTEAENDSTSESEEYEEEEESNETTEDSSAVEKTDSTKVEDVLDGEQNPINDATEENIKNNNYTPVVNTSSKDIKEKKEKVKKIKEKKGKKEKPKYGKYQYADTDPYIQEWEQTLKEEENNPSEQIPLTEQEPVAKTYTQNDYEQVYRDAQVPTFSFIHGVDTEQYYDMKDTMWSPYPLLRLNSPLYFKTIAIEPGYYLLTPRKYKDNWYILFKEAGTVKYIIPVFERSSTPVNYYRDNLKEVDMSRSGRWQIKFLNAWGKHVRKSKRKPATKCNVELTDLDNNFLLIDLYYGAHKYSSIYRVEKF